MFQASNDDDGCDSMAVIITELKTYICTQLCRSLIMSVTQLLMDASDCALSKSPYISDLDVLFT